MWQDVWMPRLQNFCSNYKEIRDIMYRNNGIKNSICMSMIVSSLLTICAMWLYIRSEYNGTFGKYNIIAFISISAFYMVCIILFYVMFYKCRLFGKGAYLEKLIKLVTVMSFLFFGGLFVSVYFMETKVFAYENFKLIRHILPPYFYIIFILLVSWGMFTLVRKNMNFYGGGRTFVAGLLSFAMGILFYAPNVFLDTYGSIFHTHAYQNSIINVMELQPYSDYSTSIYGHYGLFYYPLVKLFGDDMRAISISIAVIGVFAFACMFYVLSCLMKKDVVFILTCLAVCAGEVEFYWSGQYYQMAPHRWVFPALLLAIVCRSTVLSCKKEKLIFHILLCMSMIWNLETGIVLEGAYICYSIYSDIQYEGKINLKILKSFFYSIISVSIDFAMGYILVNIYNLLTGGSWNSIIDYIFPFMSNKYSIDSLTTPLPGIASFYMMEMLIFLGTSVWCIMKLFTKEHENEKVFRSLFFNALSGLGGMVYFINRTAYANITICHFQTVVILGIFIDTYWRKKTDVHFKSFLRNDVEKLLRSFVAVLSLIVVTALSVSTIFYYGGALTRRVNNSWRADEFIEFAEQVDENVPDGVMAFGMGVPEIYFQLGRDTRCHVLDWSDMNEYVREKILAELKDEKVLFAQEGALNYMFPDQNYKILWDITYERMGWVDYSKKAEYSMGEYRFYLVEILDN